MKFWYPINSVMRQCLRKDALTIMILYLLFLIFCNLICYVIAYFVRGDEEKPIGSSAESQRFWKSSCCSSCGGLQRRFSMRTTSRLQSLRCSSRCCSLAWERRFPDGAPPPTCGTICGKRHGLPVSCLCWRALCFITPASPPIRKQRIWCCHRRKLTMLRQHRLSMIPFRFLETVR